MYLSWSLKKEIYDVPNERSSHTTPTPRGGGLVIVLVCLTTYFAYLQFSDQKIIWAYFLGALLVSVISWLDDLYSLSIIWRFLCHSIAAALILFSCDFPVTVALPVFGIYDISSIGYLFWFLWIVWLINAYNFMDGIDGIAGIQALSAGIFWVVLSSLYGINGAAVLGLIIAVSAFAFLLFNRQPAKIFMGDVGSAFLGFNFAVMPIIAFQKSPENSGELTIAGILFVWFFVFDSVKTLFQRIFQKKKFWEAHREHLYQKLIIQGYSHNSVSLIYGILTFLISILFIIYLNFGFPFDILILSTMFLTSLGLLIWAEVIKIPRTGLE